MDSSESVINCYGDDNTERRSANFHPSIWGDFFLAFETLEMFPDEGEKQDLEELKEEIRMMLMKCYDHSLLKLHMIDNIQRLGISYHFEDEINTSLLNIYELHMESLLHKNDDEIKEEENLHNVALRFRLLRQQGHRASSEMLKKFLNKDGEFDESLTSDVLGMLSLHEACHYRVHGEEILDEALSFTTTALKSMASNSSDFMANKINHSLKWPIRKTLDRVRSRLFISLYQQDESHDEVLLKLAKLDFNAVQRLHKQELCGLTKWWKKIDCDRNFPFARDRLVECYYVVVGIYFEPQYSLGRKILTKISCLVTILDDMYDTYGTIDELLLFTDATKSWSMDSVNHLPSYMKPIYQAYLDFYTEMEVDLVKNDRSEQVHYVKEEMKKVAKTYYEQAIWYHNNYLPTMEKYLESARCSMLMNMLATTSYAGISNMATEVLDWSLNDPLIIQAASTIGRLMNDIRAKEDGDNAATAVKCYMNEYDVPRKTAIDELYKLITNAWKDLNSECLSLTSNMVPMIITERVLNIAKMMNTLFKEIDSFTHSKSFTKQLITLVFIDPVI